MSHAVLLLYCITETQIQPVVHLAKDGYVIGAVVVGQRLHESVAEARLSGTHGALVLFSAREPHHGQGDELGGAGAGGRVAAAKGQA